MSTALSEVNSVLNCIHNVIQKSGLHFIINQTPWSSYITIRKKFTSPGSYGDNLKDMESVVVDELTAMDESKKQIEENNEETVTNLISRIHMLENALKETQADIKNKNTEILELEKEKKMKDEVIKNLNVGLINKAAESNINVNKPENLKNETLKSERKALKKLRQKSEKEAVKNIIESDADAEAVKISSDKLPDTETVLAETKSSSLLLSSPVRQCSPVRRSPSTPLSPHTPPGLPPPATTSLSCYFVNSATNILKTESQNSIELKEEPKISTDYIKNISKINLVPWRGKN